MFVSILQRFGFGAPQRASEPLQSRADPNTRKAELQGQSDKKQIKSRGKVATENRQTADKPGNLAADRAGLTDSRLARKQQQEPEGYPQADSPRRHTVQAQAKKSKTKTTVNAKTQPAVKPAVKVKPAATKGAVKAAKKAVKPAKATVPAVKARQIVKTVPKKKAAPVASKKAVTKPVPKPIKAVAKLTKPVTKILTKSSPKAVAKAAAHPVAKSSKTTETTKTTKAGVSPKAAPLAASVLAAPPPSSSVLMAPKPLKPGRRSSARTAIQSPPSAPMVPTHAPDAAKASYAAMAERVIAPPIQAATKKDPKLANNWKSKPAEQLTDEEVKAMPDSEYMNEKQLAFFRHKLSVLKQDIHDNAGETTEHLRADTVVVPDPADRATIEEEHALELRTRDRERKLLKKIEQSIARIDSGDYGYCDETGEPIGVGRLIARPTANLSLEAQQRRELKQKMFGD